MTASPRERLDKAEVARRLGERGGWTEEAGGLVRRLEFPSFRAALEFVYRLGHLAEDRDHHPDLRLDFRRVTVRFSTHSAGGITDLDFAMAAESDRLAAEFERPNAAWA